MKIDSLKWFFAALLFAFNVSANAASNPSPDFTDMHTDSWAAEAQLPINGAIAKLPCLGQGGPGNGRLGAWCPKVALEFDEPASPIDIAATCLIYIPERSVMGVLYPEVCITKLPTRRALYEDSPQEELSAPVIDVASKCLVYIPEQVVNGHYYPEICITKLPSRRALFEGLPQEQLPASLMDVAAICLLWSDGTSDVRPGGSKGGATSGNGDSVGRYCVIRQR